MKKGINFLAIIMVLSAASTITAQDRPAISKDILYDKVLGSLVGSAMGDAMGASTEMWSREDRTEKYGYINHLTAPEIEPSAEGVWGRGYPAGSTTDDTRWKYLAGHFMADHIQKFYQKNGPDPQFFTNHILDYYEEQRKALNSVTGTERELAERRVNWIVEWADVSKAYQSGDIEKYNTALSKFYGGDLLCAGLLYSPVFGLPYPGQPDKAYQSAFRLAIFDQGYARDLTGLASAMVAAAMAEGATPTQVISTVENIDPHGFSERRLFTRYAVQSLHHVQSIIHEANNSGLKGSEKREFIWSELEMFHQDVSPHAREIFSLSITAMHFSDFEFQPAIEFLVNYGRDNDTTSALTGAVLGAYHGFEKLPDYKSTVLNVSQAVHGIDLEVLAQEITNAIINGM